MGNEPLLEVVRKLGGWPVLGEKSGWTATSERAFNWLDLLIKFRRLGFSHDVLIDLSVTPDFRNNTRHIIDVSCFLARALAPCCCPTASVVPSAAATRAVPNQFAFKLRTASR